MNTVRRGMRKNSHHEGNKTTSRGRQDQQRAARFRTRQETSHVIRLVDEYGNQRFVCQQGRMGITKHQTVLSALEKRALRYRKKGHKQADMDEILYENALDETGTVSTAALSESENEFSDAESTYYNVTTEYTERMEIEGVSDEVLTVHGIAPGKNQRV